MSEPTYGDPRIEPHFWANVTVDGNGCWIWTACRVPTNYGQVTRHINGVRKKFGTHRYTYERLVGPIPEGLQLDHLCRVRPCCNPAHLEPVTGPENSRRAAIARTHCPEGHPYSGPNLYLDPNSRRKCRTCTKGYRQAARERMGEDYLARDRDRAREYRDRKNGVVRTEPVVVGRRPSEYLTVEQCKAIVAMRASGATNPEIAKAFDISPAHASRVARGLVSGRAA